MTETYNAEWYDTVMVEEDSPAMLPLEDSPWLEVYERVTAMIDPHEEVVDLGCGTGRFIALLYRQGHYARITGVDWSVTALGEAESYAKPQGTDRTAENLRVDGPAWVLGDLMDWRPDGLRAGNTVYTCLETLEHLEDDLDLVRRIPPGHRLVITVPNFDSESHVRIFPHVKDVFERYEGLCQMRSWSMVGSERKAIHVCETIRRSDAW